MAELKVKYTAIDPYYSDQEQVFIGVDLQSCYDQKYEFEDWLGSEHADGITSIYKTEIIEKEE